MTEGIPGFDQAVKAVEAVGFPIVAFLLVVLAIVAPILALLRYVVFDAVRYFTTRLDSMSHEQAAAFSRVADAIDRQSEQIASSREMAAQNGKAIEIMLQFLSHTQQEVVAHRSVVEGAGSLVPSPPMQPAVQDNIGHADCP